MQQELFIIIIMTATIIGSKSSCECVQPRITSMEKN